MFRQVVEVRATEAPIEVFHRGTRIASHARSGVKHRHTPIPEHMPSAHRRYAFWTPARLLAAAEKIGPSTVALCEAIMRTKPHPEQGFRSCLGILRMEKTYGARRIEVACQRAVPIPQNGNNDAPCFSAENPSAMLSTDNPSTAHTKER